MRALLQASFTDCFFSLLHAAILADEQTAVVAKPVCKHFPT